MQKWSAAQPRSQTQRATQYPAARGACPPAGTARKPASSFLAALTSSCASTPTATNRAPAASPWGAWGSRVTRKPRPFPARRDRDERGAARQPLVRLGLAGDQNARGLAGAQDAPDAVVDRGLHARVLGVARMAHRG